MKAVDEVVRPMSRSPADARTLVVPRNRNANDDFIAAECRRAADARNFASVRHNDAHVRGSRES